MLTARLKPVIWIASSKKDLKSFPDEVQHDVGTALTVAQYGGKAHNVKVMGGFGSGQVLDVLEDHQGNTYRAVYTVRFARALVVLHCFQKKSKRGGEIPKEDKELIEKRLRDAESIYSQWLKLQDKAKP